MDRLIQAMPVIAAVACGGAFGALARFGISQAVAGSRIGTAFPVATFIANMVGCLVIGFCFVWLGERGAGSPALRSGIQIGFLGALTTFSTYSLESLNLLVDRQYGYAAANILGSVVLGLAAAYLGIISGRAIFSTG